MASAEFHESLRRTLLAALGAGALFACGGESESSSNASSSGGAGGASATANTSSSAATSSNADGDTTSSSDSGGGPNSNAAGGSASISTNTANTTSSGATGTASSGSAGGATGAGGAMDSSSSDSEVTTASSSTSSTTGSTEECLGVLWDFCLTEAQMVSIAQNGVGELPLDPPRSDEEIAAGFDANGCMRYDWIATGCCNPALGPGVPEGDTCCYQACESACCGRPLVIAGTSITARAEARGDWQLAQRYASFEQLPPAFAEPLGALWLGDALAEHASVAAFARLSLELLAFGAPAGLVSEATRAMADEIDHARRCFGVASQLLDRELGPGPLSAATHPLEGALGDLVVATIHEGCVGESLSAAIAYEQAELTHDPELKRTLRTIADDEARHAALGFRLVAWALNSSGPHLRQRARQAFERALTNPPGRPPTPEIPERYLHAAGRLTAAEAARSDREVIRTALRPAAEALLALGEAPRPVVDRA